MIKVDMTPISLTVFTTQIKFDAKFNSLSSKFYFNNCNKILHMSQQQCCRGMCKKLLQFDGQKLKYSKLNFHQMWIVHQILLVKWAHSIKWHGMSSSSTHSSNFSDDMPQGISTWLVIHLLHAELFEAKIKIRLHFLSFSSIETSS